MTLDASLIELLLAPAVLIPACALLAMSASARLSSILTRVRDLHGQRLEAYQAHSTKNDRAATLRAIRMEGLEVQSHHLIRRASLTRISLVLIYASIAALLLSSGFLGIAVYVEPGEMIAVGLFLVGLAVLLLAVIVAIIDVQGALRWVRYEHGRVEALDDNAS